MSCVLYAAQVDVAARNGNLQRQEQLLRHLARRHPGHVDVLSLQSRAEEKRAEQAATGGASLDYLFEPSQGEVMEILLAYELEFQLGQILLEARASEHSARMVAMKNATDSAQQLVKDLTLEYNKIRQSNITKELLEIATAQMALG